MTCVDLGSLKIKCANMNLLFMITTELHLQRLDTYKI